MSKYCMYFVYPILILSFRNDFQRTVLQPERKKGKIRYDIYDERTNEPGQTFQ